MTEIDNQEISPAGFDILYEEGPCLIVAKPGGVLTQAPPGIDSMELRIKRFLAQRDGKTGNIYLGIPHRLDRPVSGVMAFAKHSRAARRITEQFEGRIAEKKYWALVSGTVEPAEGTCTDYLRKVPGEARAEVVDKDHKEGRIAVLHYRTLKRLGNISCLEIKLETGRTHQIRVQMSSLGFPILGDELYGATELFGPVTTDRRARWIGLHARSLRIRHPMTREIVLATAPLPEPWIYTGVDLISLDHLARSDQIEDTTE